MAPPAVLMFHIGTNNWQRQGEFAPGSGILHASMHQTFNGMQGVRCYSIYPSKRQTQPEDDKTYRVFQIDHDIPICESVSPNSSYRWHSMNDEQFTAYRKRQENEICDYMDQIEKWEGKEFDYIVSHHAFTNAMTGAQIVERRHKEGKTKVRHFNFVHGTALKMFIKEKDKDPEYPLRFLPIAQGHGVFNSVGGCCGVFVNSEDYIGKFLDCFSAYPKDRCEFSRIGVNQTIFCPKGTSIEKDLAKHVRDEDKGKLAGIKKMITFVGKFADWKRLDAVLYAAALYEKKYPELATAVIGSGPPEAVELYEGMAKKLGLERTLFLGAKGQDVLAEVFSMSQLGMFPSYKEPFGMVFIECMACGTPTIGCDSGGPTEFMKDSVGRLIPEEAEWRTEEGMKRLGARLADTISEALDQDWKKSKGADCVAYVKENYSTVAQCESMLASMKAWSKAEEPAGSAEKFVTSDGKKVRVLDSEAGIGAAVCEEFVAAYKAAVSAKGAFSVAVPGGSIVAALANLPKGEIDASKVHVFFCNERIGEGKCYKGAMKSLVDPLGIPTSQVHKVPEGTPEEVAAAYVALLKGQLPNVVSPNYAGIPSVDLVLLGTGEDGHVGSLHPNKKEIKCSGNGEPVLAINEGGKTSIAVSLDFICAAKRVVLSAAKKSRAPMVRRALRTGSGYYDCPASMVCARDTTWLVDKDSISEYRASFFDPPVAHVDSYWSIPGMKAGVVTGDVAWSLLRFAKAQGFAIPAVNCTTTSSINAVLEAGKELKRPVIIQFSQGGSAFFAGKSLTNKEQQASILGAVAGAHYVRAVAPAYGIPVIVHSDHCAKKLLPWFDGMLEFDEAFFAARGEPLFSSHMLDLSEEPHEENIGICAKYMERMAKVNLILEMEIGLTGGVEDGVDNSGVDKDKLYSTSEEVWQVYEALAPISEKFTIAAAFGNVHGVYKPGNVKLRPELLDEFQKYAGNKLQRGMPFNFVFHGGSGSEKEKIDEALSYGVVKMNVDTDTQWAYWEGLKDFYQENEHYLQGQIGNPKGLDKPNKNFYDPRKWVRASEETMRKRVIESCTDLNNMNP